MSLSCFATLRDITINCFGHICLCCYDCNNQVTFGNLHKQSLMEILNSNEFLKTHNELTNGIRKFEICRRCSASR
ncbi:MAG: hypothetical protein GY816_13235 [Cytophagales bacterium]|nr:hypothetical protein [Cytophagales bacterium]